MENLVKHCSKTPYCIYELPEDEKERKRCEKLLAELKDRCPALVMMNMKCPDEQASDEFDTYFLLRKIHTTDLEE